VFAAPGCEAVNAVRDGKMPVSGTQAVASRHILAAALLDSLTDGSPAGVQTLRERGKWTRRWPTGTDGPDADSLSGLDLLPDQSAT
jgi:hypothetical protein